MRFAVSDELRLFGESIRSAIGDWEPPSEPELGSWRHEDLASQPPDRQIWRR